VSEQDNLTIAQQWIAAVNAHDTDAIAATLHPTEFVWELATSSTTGSAASQQAWQMFIGGFPDFHFETERMIASGDYVVSQVRMTGTHSGEFRFRGTNSMSQGIPPSDKPINLPGCAIHEVRNGKIVHLWAYWDTATLLRQIGVLPGA
jgi:steroid delta-isomerase-like uncharacterized protein